MEERRRPLLTSAKAVNMLLEHNTNIYIVLVPAYQAYLDVQVLKHNNIEEDSLSIIDLRFQTVKLIDTELAKLLYK